MDNLTIAPMDTRDLEQVLAWAAAEGWNPGLADAPAFYASDPEGFYLARVLGKPVAAISVVNHDPKNAFLGLYLCLPEFRGKGIGFATWQAALEHTGTRSVGLDGVPAQEANYRASGFVKTGSSMRHVGRWEPRTSIAVRVMKPADSIAVSALDASAVGYRRPAFLGAWLAPKLGLRETLVLECNGRVVGSATWRACGECTKIGPVLAPDLAGALGLISAVASRRPNGPLIVDVPEANTALRAELTAAGFNVPFVTARMYRGEAPEVGVCLQAIATMELG
jgi:GNAT superfamily N-acetyltransferase